MKGLPFYKMADGLGFYRALYLNKGQLLSIGQGWATKVGVQNELRFNKEKDKTPIGVVYVRESSEEFELPAKVVEQVKAAKQAA